MRTFRTVVVQRMVAVTALFTLAIGSVSMSSSSAQALPTTTSWTNAGLQEMVRVAGHISVSTSGAGFGSGSTPARTGTIQVEKPTANAKVVAAYFTAAVTDYTALNAAANDADPGISLNGSNVTFSHKAKVKATTYPASGNYAGEDLWYVNYFSNVTSQVKSTLDAASSGISTLAVDEGTRFNRVEGTSLIVVFEDAALPTSSAVIMFGTSNPAGDSFTIAFPALTDTTVQKPTLSLGISYSYQVTNRTQSSTVKIATSSNATQQAVSNTAGGQNDGFASDGGLITVGGIGDSRALPNLSPSNFAQGEDDELYGLESFMAVGDTSMTFTTRNATLDDNIFQAVLFLEGVEVTGALTAEDLADQAQGTAPADLQGSVAASSSASLAATGVENAFGFAALAAMLIALGFALTRRARTRG